MNKLELEGQNLGRALGPSTTFITEEQLHLKLKTQPKQLSGSPPLAFGLPGKIKKMTKLFIYYH